MPSLINRVHPLIDIDSLFLTILLAPNAISKNWHIVSNYAGRRDCYGELDNKYLWTPNAAAPTVLHHHPPFMNISPPNTSSVKKLATVIFFGWQCLWPHLHHYVTADELKSLDTKQSQNRLDCSTSIVPLVHGAAAHLAQISIRSKGNTWIMPKQNSERWVKAKWLSSYMVSQIL